MNTTECPSLHATDVLFQVGTVGSCDTPLVGFYIYSLTPAVLSLATATKQLQNWMRRQTHKSKIPRGPISSFLFSGFQFLGVALSGTNLVNFDNGLSFMLFSIVFLNFAYAYTIGLIRLVSLGEKIIPKSRRPVGESSIKLGSFDNLGKIIFGAQLVFLLLSSLALIILSPILVDHEAVISRVGWGAKSVFMFLCQCGYWYQFERCIRAVRSVRDIADPLRGGDHERELRTRELNAAVRKMRNHQLVHFSASPGTIIFALLAADAVPGSFWVIYFTAISQAIGGLFFEFSVKVVSNSKEGRFASAKRVDTVPAVAALPQMAPLVSSSVASSFKELGGE